MEHVLTVVGEEAEDEGELSRCTSMEAFQG